MELMPDKRVDLRERSVDTLSVISLEESIHVAAVLSDLTPVQKSFDHIDLKLGNIERKLNELHNKSNENWEIEREWKRREAEIFSTASAGVRKGGRKERKLLKREKFLKKMAHPKRECVKAVTDGISLSYHAQIVRSALDKPGTGEYDTAQSSFDSRAGSRFSTANPKSDVDWQILRASENLMSYVKLPSTLETWGGAFNKSAKPLTERDWQVKRSKEVPGPGKYDTRPLGDKLSHDQRGKFSVAKPKTDVEWMVHRGLENPGSHIMLPSTLKTSGGAFNQSVKSLAEQDWQVKRASLVPAPGDYTLSSLRTSTGGKFNTGNSKNDIEWKIYNSRHTPGPGSYDVSQSIDASSEHVKAGHSGKFNMVYRPLQQAHAHLAKGTAKAEEMAAMRRHTVSLSPLEIRRASISLFEGDGVEAAQRAERRHTNGAPARDLVLWKQAQKLLKDKGKEGGDSKRPVTSVLTSTPIEQNFLA
mmetsp:Transcript_54527/g.109654  ORF Transcript_54527/g.109654 Transcript_54527/m.109654 type:complete len:474 (+) Transcript_54527:174-1595(+)